MSGAPAAHCSDCGAPTTGAGLTCTSRFEQLIALDHSRREPWGPRHGLAFAVYALQHPSRFDRSTRERSWLILYRVYRVGDDPTRLVEAIRRHRDPRPEAFGVPPLPDRADGGTFPMTIADLGSLEAARYADDLDAWCRSTLAALGAGGLPTGARTHRGAVNDW